MSPGHSKRGAVAIAAAMPTLARTLAAHLWSGRGFSDRTRDALICAGCEFPEQLLFAHRVDIAKLKGVGKAALAEIDAYRIRFLPHNGKD